MDSKAWAPKVPLAPSETKENAWIEWSKTSMKQVVGAIIRVSVVRVKFVDGTVWQAK